MEFSEYIKLISQNPLLAVLSVLTLGVILVNGWTDAPNAIATCVSTRALGVKKAIIMSAVFNFLGVLVMSALSPAVAFTIYNIADFGGNTGNSLAALCAAMAAIVIWAAAAWYFGIPTSESHALIAGVSGAAVALGNGFSAINGEEWLKVLYGIVLSVLLGFFSGFFTAKLTVALFKNKSRIKSRRFFTVAQTAGGAAMSFMHGAQDGQKFMAIFLLGASLSGKNADAQSFNIPVWLMLLCSVVMGLGTSIGGYRIIKSVGMDMVRLTPYQGFSADFAAAFCLLFSSLTGLPVSTTHTKTTAVMGVGAARRARSVNKGIVRDLALAWIFTFPGCGILGYLMAKIFLR